MVYLNKDQNKITLLPVGSRSSVFEGDDTVPAGEAAPATPVEPAPAPAPAAAPAAPKSDFTDEQQEKINAMIAKEKREWQEKLNKTVEELEAHKATATITTEERGTLENTIKNLRQQALTEKQLSEQSHEKQVAELTASIDDISGKYKSLQNEFVDSTITRALTDAAATSKAYSPTQIVAILRDKTRIEDVLDAEGNKTGSIVNVDLPSIDEKTKEPINLKLSADKAVEHMRGMSEYENLFQFDGHSGLGLNTRPSTNPNADRATVAKDATAYREMRAAEGKIPN